MCSEEKSIEVFGNTLESLIKITNYDIHTCIVYLQECNKEKKQKLYTFYTLENVLSCISKNKLQWKQMNLQKQQLELEKECINKIY